MADLYGKISNIDEEQTQYQTLDPLNDMAIDETWKYVTPIGFTLRKTIPYIQYMPDIWAGRNLLFHKPFDKMTKEEYNDYEKIGRDYYQNYLQKNPVNVQEYGKIEFGHKNKGKDKTYNFEQYPFLRKNLETAKKENFSTNYKNETDRNYDYFSNEYKGNLYNYIIENINGIGKRYKMMRNKTKDEK